MIEDLKKPFPKEKVSWRSQTMNKEGNRALALAYIDARDVMDRLDEVVGAEFWMDEYETTPERTMCRLSIKINDEWVSKTDGAGDTNVEAQKGSISDAFKRAAVKWGVGRYLYDMPAIWVPCQSYQRNGKNYFKKFTADPWSLINQEPPDGTPDQLYDELQSGIQECSSVEELDGFYSQNERKFKHLVAANDSLGGNLRSMYAGHRKHLEARMQEHQTPFDRVAK